MSRKHLVVLAGSGCRAASEHESWRYFICHENDSGTGNGDDKHDGSDGGSDGGSDCGNFSSGGILCLWFFCGIMLDLDRVCCNHK